MEPVTPNDTASNVSNVLAHLLANAFVIAVQHPEVIAAARAIFTPPSANDADPIMLVSKNELARHLGISPATVDRHDRAGAPFEIVGTRKRYSVIARRRWLTKRGRFSSAPKAKRDDVDVTDIVSRNGLTVITGGGR